MRAGAAIARRTREIALLTGLSAWRGFVGFYRSDNLTYAASIGYSASHGCIRMLIPQVEWLFDQVEIGTPVFIVR